jgi:hypothetical protein
MTKIEALKMALDGHKVRHTHWKPEICLIWDTGHFRLIHNKSVVSLSASFDEDGWELYQPLKQKKLVELKFWINENGWCWFHSELKEASWKEIPYTIKDGKIFIEVDTDE